MNASFSPHDERQRSYFEGKFNSNMFPRPSRYLERHVREAMTAAGAAPGMKTLEVGCGMGRYTFTLLDAGLDVEGLDLAPGLLDRMRTFAEQQGRDPSRLVLHCANISKIPDDLKGRFDLVMGFFVLHHLEELEAPIASVAAALKPGGRMVFVEPSPLNPAYYFQIALTPRMKWKAERGILNMRPSKVLGAMKLAGMGDLELRRFGFFPPLIADTGLGSRLTGPIERFPIWGPLLTTQIFSSAKV